MRARTAPNDSQKPLASGASGSTARIATSAAEKIRRPPAWRRRCRTICGDRDHDHRPLRWHRGPRQCSVQRCRQSAGHGRDIARTAACAATLPVSLRGRRQPREQGADHADVETGDRHQVTRAAARELAPLLGTQRILQPDRESYDDARCRPLAQPLDNQLREPFTQPQDRRVPAMVRRRVESASGAYVARGAEILPQQTRGQIGTARVGKAPGPPQPDVECPPLGRVRRIGAVIPRELDPARQLHARLRFDSDVEADGVCTSLGHRVDDTCDRQLGVLDRRRQPCVEARARFERGDHDRKDEDDEPATDADAGAAESDDERDAQLGVRGQTRGKQHAADTEQCSACVSALSAPCRQTASLPRHPVCWRGANLAPGGRFGSAGVQDSILQQQTPLQTTRDLRRVRHQYQACTEFAIELEHELEHALGVGTVEVARRLVREHDLGTVTSARATAVRCRSPPDNCAGR